MNNALVAPTRVPRSAKIVAQNQVPPASFGVAGAAGLSGSSSGVIGSVFGAGTGGNTGGGVYRATDAIAEGDVSTNAFDDFFEYSLTQPVTIHKNESAMVPILQQELPAEHVTLWSRSDPRPLRAVWLENKSKLTLDAGSFSVFESGEFAGEGLLDPIHPGERRLLSYAADQATRVKITDQQSRRTIHHLQIRKGLIVERYMDVMSMTYSATNSGDDDRVVLLEHPRRTNGWSLDEGVKAAETTPDLYRFKVAVKPHATEKLEVSERGPEYTTVSIDPNQNTNSYLIDLIKRVPDAEVQLKPILDAQARLADLDQAIANSKKQEETAAADEARARENLTALKGNDAARRFVEELNRAEDLLQSTRKHTADLEQQKATAVDNLRAQINALSYDWDVTQRTKKPVSKELREAITSMSHPERRKLGAPRTYRSWGKRREGSAFPLSWLPILVHFQAQVGSHKSQLPISVYPRLVLVLLAFRLCVLAVIFLVALIVVCDCLRNLFLRELAVLTAVQNVVCDGRVSLGLFHALPPRVPPQRRVQSLGGWEASSQLCFRVRDEVPPNPLQVTFETRDHLPNRSTMHSCDEPFDRATVRGPFLIRIISLALPRATLRSSGMTASTN